MKMGSLSKICGTIRTYKMDIHGKKLPSILVSVLFLLFHVKCAANFQNFPSETETNHLILPSNVPLPSSDDGYNLRDCHEIGSKRIVKAFYMVPLNALREDEIKKPDYPIIRYRTVIRGSDIFYSFLGFMLSFVTETVVVDACPGRIHNELEEVSSFGSPPVLDYAIESNQKRANPYAVYFPPDSAVLSRETSAKLVEIAKQLQKNDWKILIVGHADTTGSEYRNRDLGWQRARALALKLQHYGIDSSRFLLASASSEWSIHVSGEEQKRGAEVILIHE